jgi:hypothetical protein
MSFRLCADVAAASSGSPVSSAKKTVSMIAPVRRPNVSGRAA